MHFVFPCYKIKAAFTNFKQSAQTSNMQHMKIICFALIGLATIVIAMPQASYNNLSYSAKHNASQQSQNTTLAQTQRQLSTKVAATTNQSKHNEVMESLESKKAESLPGFNYAVLGQDPKDQHWYRVGLTPKDHNSNKAGYRAQIATRKLPPYDEEQAHKHEKAISELLQWLQTEEKQSLRNALKELLSTEMDNEQAESQDQDVYILEQQKHSY